MKPSLRKRMLLAYLLGSALLVTAAVLALVGANRVIAMYDKDVGNLQEARADMLLLVATYRMQQLEWQNLLSRGHDADLRDKHWQAFEKQEKAVQERTARLLGRLPAGDARRFLKGFGDAHRQMGASFRKGFNAFRAGNFDPRLGDQAVAGIERLPTELLDQAVAGIASAVAEYRRQAASAALSARQLAIVLIAALALGGVAIFGIKTHFDILVPLRDLMDQVGRLARGELAEPVTSFADGELREMAAGIEEVRGRVARLLDGAKRSSDSLALSAIELKGAAEAAVRNIETGNQSLSALAAATDRMIATMRAVGEKSLAIQNAAVYAAAKTRAGNTTLREMAHGLELVDRLLGEISRSVSGFAAGTRGIKGMTSRVQEIADRTQLLAVNASIEAAQSGERGRAFAAVAEEVRALAQHSARAAQEIATLSHRLNLYSGEVEKVLQRGRVRLTASLAESQAADQMLLQALEAVTAAAEGVAALVDSIRQQETGIQQASSVTLEVAAETEQHSASVGRIRRVIDQLRRCAVDHHRRAMAAAHQ